METQLINYLIDTSITCYPIKSKQQFKSQIQNHKKNTVFSWKSQNQDIKMLLSTSQLDGKPN